MFRSISILLAASFLLISQQALATSCGTAGQCKSGEKCCRIGSQTYCKKECSFSVDEDAVNGEIDIMAKLKSVGLTISAMESVTVEMSTIYERDEATSEFEPSPDKLCLSCKKWKCKRVSCD